MSSFTPTKLPLPTFKSNAEAALYWFNFGLKVVPSLPNSTPALNLELWLPSLTEETIQSHWALHPSHDISCMVSDNLVVFGTSNAAANSALGYIEAEQGCPPLLITKTSKGYHHYFLVAPGTYPVSVSHSVDTNQDRIDVKSGCELMLLPPSLDHEIHRLYAERVDALCEVGQDFIDEVFKHNGQQPPRLPEPSVRVPVKESPLAAYSLRDQLGELEKQLVEQKHVLGQLVLMGQATVLYAPPNTGKTLLVLHMVIDTIRKKVIDPSQLFYINMDDNSNGLVDKLRLAEEYGFHMLADGYQGFRASEFRQAMLDMVADDTAQGVIVVLDTLKKFINVMDKSKSSEFTKIIRRFVLKGGTVVTLSHTNKNLGADGRAVYSGTSDIVDDFDCAYILSTLAQQSDPTERVVEFTNIKRRGNVAQTAAYSYTLDTEVPYGELLMSVQEVNADQLMFVRQATEIQSDASLIESIEGCIRDGITTKMELAAAAAERAGCSKRSAIKIVDKYTGNDYSIHRWNFTVRERGAKVFILLAPPSGPTDDPPLS